MFNGRRQPSRGGTSRMTRECQVRFCEGLGVKFPGPTRQSRRFGRPPFTSGPPRTTDLARSARIGSFVPCVDGSRCRQAKVTSYQEVSQSESLARPFPCFRNLAQRSPPKRQHLGRRRFPPLPINCEHNGEKVSSPIQRAGPVDAGTPLGMVVQMIRKLKASRNRHAGRRVVCGARRSWEFALLRTQTAVQTSGRRC